MNPAPRLSLETLGKGGRSAGLLKQEGPSGDWRAFSKEICVLFGLVAATVMMAPVLGELEIRLRV